MNNRLTARRDSLVSQLTLDAREMRLYRPTITAAMAVLALDSLVSSGMPDKEHAFIAAKIPAARLFSMSNPGRDFGAGAAPNRSGDRMRARFYPERHQERDS